MKQLSLFVLLFSSSLFAQDFNFGKVSDSEVKQQLHPLDSSAIAAVLYKKGSTKMIYEEKWYYVHEIESRVKIYKKEGFDYATVKIPMYDGGGGNKEKISNIKAFTYNLENGKINREKLKSDGQFEEEITENWRYYKFTLPNVKEGSVIEFTYRVTSPFINSLPEFTFQEKIPVANVEYTIEIPEYLNYRAYSKGFFPLKQTKTSRREKLLISYRADTDPQVGGLGNINSLRTERGQIEFNLETTVYSVTQLPKLVEEEYVNNMDNYLNSIKHELEWTKMPGSSLETYTHSWDDVAKSIYKHSRFGNEIDTREYFEQDLDPLLKTAQNSFEKIKIVFDFVKQKVKWNEKYGVLVKDGVKKAYSQRTGNVAEINLMLTGMLRYAGLNANPILVSTRANGIAYFPTREGFNYVIAAVELNNELILLDATNEFTEPNILTEKTLNWVGRLIRSDFSSVEVDLMPKILSKRVFDLNIKMDLQGTINGRCRNSYTNHEALNYRNNFAGKSDKAYEEIIENNYSLMEISDIDITNRKETDKPYIENFNFNKTSSFDALGDRIYFQPLFFMATTKNPFKAEEREFPIDFSFPRSKIVRLQIEIPEGYKIESAPESATYKLPDDLGEFTYLISTTENTINLRVISEIKASILPAGYYSALKEYYKLVVEKETEKIVLVKS
ncbi:MAG: hypothetical protein AUK33_10225 [Flavobacteriaceae bacterium CG2_30_34_30]|nr:MAG: hypothetical protein AUK33_10225 [Flavobacteriaceae bacterium CG2_30_34_30]PIZ07808.1 MAG: transglutaminase [Flavobacteriaceae bacterium CG_4_10_14_0_8_um_filter_34_31]